MTNEQYENNEIERHQRHILEVEKSPLEWRKEARDKVRECFANDLPRFTQAIDNLLRGDYGHGAQLTAKMLTKRMNRTAIICQWAMNYEFMCSGAFTRQAWKEQSKEIQNELDSIVIECLE